MERKLQRSDFLILSKDSKKRKNEKVYYVVSVDRKKQIGRDFFTEEAAEKWLLGMISKINKGVNDGKI